MCYNTKYGYIIIYMVDDGDDDRSVGDRFFYTQTVTEPQHTLKTQQKQREESRWVSLEEVRGFLYNKYSRIDSLY